MSQALRRLRTEFADRALTEGKMFLLKSDDAWEFIQRALELGEQLDGIEGLVTFTGGGVQPTQEYTYFFDAPPSPGRSQVEEVRQILDKAQGSSIRFDIFFRDEHDNWEPPVQG